MTQVDSWARAGRVRSVVTLPSRTLDRWHEPPAETQAYEERLLSSLFELRDPNLKLTYVTSSPVAAQTIDYYLSMLPGRVRRSARCRLALVALGDRSERPLTEKLLKHPDALERIRLSIPDRRLSHLVPYNATELERDLALALDIPMYGADPSHARLGTKSGSREMFELAGVPHPLGVAHIASRAEATQAVCDLRAAKPELLELVIKLDHGVSGEGNAIIDLTGLPAPGATDERALIEQRLIRLVPEMTTVTAADYLTKFATQGGIVEERITGEELRSPSAQLRISPAGKVELLSTHDQILGGPSGQSYLGCRFPADSSYAPAVGAIARRVGERLAEIGVVGHCAVDFIVTRRTDGHWERFAIELNLRMGGTTHPYQTLAQLAGGAYDSHSAMFTTARGQRRHYVATDHLEVAHLRELGRDGLLAAARHGKLRFDRGRRVGIVFHMLSSLPGRGRAGLTAIGTSAEDADARFAHARAAVARHAWSSRSPAIAKPQVSALRRSPGRSNGVHRRTAARAPTVMDDAAETAAWQGDPRDRRSDRHRLRQCAVRGAGRCRGEQPGERRGADDLRFLGHLDRVRIDAAGVTRQKCDGWRHPNEKEVRHEDHRQPL